MIGDATVQHPEKAEVHHYYELLWCDDLWKILVDETNKYAEQERRKTPPPNSCLNVFIKNKYNF